MKVSVTFKTHISCRINVYEDAGNVTDAPAGNSTRINSSGRSDLGETWRRTYPLAGSCHCGWSALRSSRLPACSARARRVESVSPKAPDRRPSKVAVGLASPRSILLIMAFETPDLSASSANDQLRASRSRAIRAARDSVGSLTIVDISLL